MKMIGIIEGVFRNKHTGEITKRLAPVENHIQNYILSGYRQTNSSILTAYDIGEHIFVSSYNPGGQTRNLSWQLHDVKAREGVDIEGVSAKSFYYASAPGVHLYTVTQRFNPPAETFTINTVGLCSYVQNPSSEFQIVNTPSNIVWLATPCIHTTEETLDIYYRVQFLYEENYLNNTEESRNLLPSESWYYARGLTNYTSQHIIPGHYSTKTLCRMEQSKVNSRAINNKYYSSGYDSPRHSTLLMSGSSTTPAYKASSNYFTALENNIGFIATHVGTPYGHLMFKLHRNGESPIQSVFGHNDTSTTPFFTSQAPTIGVGTMEAQSTGAWVDSGYPEYYRIDIVTDGVMDVAEYRFKKGIASSFDGNTFNMEGIVCHWSRYGNYDKYEDFNLMELIDGDYYTAYPVYHSEDKVLFVRPNEIFLVDVTTGEGTVINNLTLIGADLSPRFLAVDISQAEVSASQDVYIACQGTGLYKFNADLSSLTVINSSTNGLADVAGCFGVHIGYNGRLWAYFGHATQDSLYYSDDDGVNWTKTAMGASDLDSSMVLAIKADPSNANHHVAILYTDPTDFAGLTWYVSVKWWNQSTTTLTQGPVDIRQHGPIYVNVAPRPRAGDKIGYQKTIECSPTSSQWAMACRLGYNNATNPIKLTFEDTSYVDITAPGFNINSRTFFVNWATHGGVDYLHAIASATSNGPGGFHSEQSCYLNPLGADEIYTIPSTHVSHDKLMFPVNSKGVWLMYEDYGTDHLKLFPITPFYTTEAANPIHHAVAYPSYGWNGTSWEVGHAGAKAVHTAEQELDTGITVSFEDNGGTFLDSDHYTFGVVDGVWLDGFTNLDVLFQMYNYPTVINTETESANLPTVTKVPNSLRKFNPTSLSDMTDVQGTLYDNAEFEASGTAVDNDYNSGFRSAAKAIDGNLSSFLPFAVPLPGEDEIKNVQGYITLELRGSTSIRMQTYVGLSPADRLGTTLNKATIKYGIHLDNIVAGYTDHEALRIRVIEDEQERTNIIEEAPNYPINIRIALLNNGSMVYQYKNDNNFAYTTLYQSPPGYAALEDLYLDTHYVPYDNYGFTEVSYFSLDASDQDYYMYLGDGIDQGIFNPDFFRIDDVQLWFDGVPAVNLGNNYAVDPVNLVANSFIVYPSEGVVRFHADDAGKAVTAEYVTLMVG